MAITRYDPFGELMRMERDLDRAFGRILSAPIEPLAESPAWIPATDVVRRGEDLVVRAELPGLRAEDVDVSVSEGLLTIRGERRLESESEEKGYVLRERRFGSFERALTIPAGIDPASITADFRDGVLEVTVPRAVALSEPRKVKVEVRAGETAPAMEAPAQAEASPESSPGEVKAA